MNVGKVVQVVGAVVDVEFPAALPPIYQALTVDYRVENQPVSLFVMPDRQSAAADVAAFGRHAEVLTRNGVTYVLVAPARLRGVAAAVGLEAK